MGLPAEDVQIQAVESANLRELPDYLDAVLETDDRRVQLLRAW